jgi:nucleotide-binding universal stress UspA family protein
MSTQPYTIIVGIDFESDGNLAFDETIRMAGRNPNAEVHALYVARELPQKTTAKSAETSGVSHRTTRAKSDLDRLETFCTERLQVALAAEPKLHVRRVVTHFRIGSPAEQLVQLGVDLMADLIVVGTHNRKGVKRLLLGSVAEKVVHRATCPVYVVRPIDHEGAGEVPEIEPPCPKCLVTRARSEGAKLWCAQHELAQFHPRMHRYSYSSVGGETRVPTDTMGPTSVN